MTFALVDTLKTLHRRALHTKCVKCGVSRQIIIYLYFLSNCLTLMPGSASVIMRYIFALYYFGPVFISTFIYLSLHLLFHAFISVCFYSEHSLCRKYYQCKYCPTHSQHHSLPTT